MCIIAIKPKNIDLPNKEYLENCFINNDDGAGFMYTKNNKVYIYKGYMDFDSFYKSVLQKIKKATPAVLHFRTATHGSVSKENCHPFPVSNNVKKLRATKIKTDIGVAHNGVIPIETEGDLSDSMQFIKEYLSNKDIRPLLRNRKILDIIERAISSSKIALLYSDGDFVNLGSPWKEKDGILYSNSDYERVYMSSYGKLSSNSWYNSHSYPYSYGTMQESRVANRQKYCRNCFGEIKVSDIYEDTFWCDTCGTNPLSELKTIDELCNEEDNAIEVCDICTEVIEEDDTRHYVKGKVYCSVCYRLFGKDEEKYTTPLKYKVYKKCPHCNKFALISVDTTQKTEICTECNKSIL
jgi:predicted glutamine amidotransferase